MRRREFITLLGGAALLTFSTFMCGNMAANAASLRIVAIGASNSGPAPSQGHRCSGDQCRSALRNYRDDAPPYRQGCAFAEMERRLHARSINVIVYDEEIPLGHRAFDFMHLTHEGHAMIAAALLPRVMKILDRRRSDVLPIRKETRG
jgi:hypothetical protein